MEYLSKDDLLDIHIFVIQRYGGLLGIASQDKLDTAINAPRQRMFEAELYPDVPSKAAILGYLIIKSHPFVSGNDATALMAMLRVLALNRLVLRPEIGSGELIWLMRALVHSDIGREALEGWLRDNCIPDA